MPDNRGSGTVRVLLVAPSIRYLGGQAVQARRLQTNLSSEQWVDVDLLAVDPMLPAPFAWLQKIKYVRTLVTSLSYVLTLIARVPRYDVVHAFSASYWSFLLAPVPAMLIGRCFGKRVIVNYRSGEAEDHLNRWGWHAIPLLRLAHVIVVPSGYLVDVFNRFGLTAISVPNFLDVSAIRYRERAPLRPVCLSNRNFEALYNIKGILQAFALIQRVHIDAELVVVGDGQMRDELRSYAVSLHLRNVTFTGAVPPEQMAAEYDRCDLYLNAPLIDNMPNSVIEAFAAGLPVVTSDAGGIPYIVRNEENGLLVPAGDAIALAEAALRVLADTALATRLSAQARDEALKRYTWHAVRRRWRAVYIGAPASGG